MYTTTCILTRTRLYVVDFGNKVTGQDGKGKKLCESTSLEIVKRKTVEEGAWWFRVPTNGRIVDSCCQLVDKMGLEAQAKISTWSFQRHDNNLESIHSNADNQLSPK